MNSALPPAFPRRLAFVYLALSAVWLLANTLVGARWTLLDTDSVLYALPLTASRHPLDFGIPFLGGFESYDRAWGHQWPGGMWLRGLVFWAVPYSRAADLAVLFACQWLAATATGLLVWRLTAQLAVAACATAVLLFDRVLVTSVEGHRFEVIAAACLAVLLLDVVRAGERRGWAWRALAAGAAFFCPTLHPYAVPLGGMIVGFPLVADWLGTRRISAQAVARAAWFAAGCATGVAWFAFQPEAWAQFRENVALQKGFARHWDTVLLGLTNYRLGAGFALWAGALAGAVVLWIVPAREPLSPRARQAERWLLPALFLAVGAAHTVTRCENFNYLALASPFAAALVACGAARLAGRLPRLVRWGPLAATAALALALSAMFPYRLLNFWKNGFPHLPADIHAVAARLPAGRTVFFPPVFWEEAARDRTRTYQLWTFAVASRRERRERYEAATVGAARPGDLLVVAGRPGDLDKFGTRPTYPLHPPDPARWQFLFEEHRDFAGKKPWGLDLTVYERK